MTREELEVIVDEVERKIPKVMGDWERVIALVHGSQGGIDLYFVCGAGICLVAAEQMYPQQPQLSVFLSALSGMKTMELLVSEKNGEVMVHRFAPDSSGSWYARVRNVDDEMLAFARRREQELNNLMEVLSKKDAVVITTQQEASDFFRKYTDRMNGMFFNGQTPSVFDRETTTYFAFLNPNNFKEKYFDFSVSTREYPHTESMPPEAYDNLKLEVPQGAEVLAFVRGMGNDKDWIKVRLELA